jgi:putative oxidoreductase
MARIGKLIHGALKMFDTLKTPLVVVGRVLLALMFILAGFGKLTDIGGTAGYIASGGLPMASVLAVIVGLLELFGGIAIAIGFQTRWAALALGLFTLAASLLFHKFWAVPADQAFVQQLMFMKNLSVAGGLFVVAALGAGAASIDNRRALVPAHA